MITPHDIAWVLRTFDRGQCDPPRENYLGRTLEAIRASMVDLLPSPTIHLVDGGGSPDLEAFVRASVGDVTTHLRLTWWGVDAPYGRLTHNQNALRALKIGLGEGKPWIVHLEDDLDVCHDLFGSIARWLSDRADSPRTLLYTFHTPYREVSQARAAGHTYWSYPIEKFYGNQCWAIRAEDAADLADWMETILGTWKSTKGFDLMIKAWALERGRTHFLASAPSFVQHIGEASSLHLGRFHQNSSWPGREWSYGA